MLHPDDAAAGLNFTSIAARELYEARRLEGWGVDPVRCTNLLTSSQALTLNLFGPLAAAPGTLVDLLNSALDRSDIVGVEVVNVEFAPRRRSDHLNDMTRLDVLVYATTAAGLLPVVIEVKYADRFNSRSTPTTTDRYVALARRTRLWSSADVLEDGRFNQLIRCHALAASLGEAEGAASLPVLLVVQPGLDTAAARLVDDYRERVAGAALVQRISLDDFVTAMGAVGEPIRQRYCDLPASESEWIASAGAS